MSLEKDNKNYEHAQDIDPRLLEILVCPLTRRALSYDKNAQELISHTMGLAFPIRNGVPIMLVEQARRFEPTQG